MQQKLSNKQLKYIEEQVTEHGGSQYLELHLEFCDHLSTAIEVAWAGGSKQSFEVLLAQEIRKFGYGGFIVLSRNREIDVNERYKKQAWRLFTDWWTWPKMFFSLATVALIYVFFSSVHEENLRSIVYNAIILSGYFYSIPLVYKHFRMLKRQTVKVLAMKMLMDHLKAYLIIFYTSMHAGQTEFLLNSNWGLSLFAFGQVSFWIVTFYIAPMMLRESWAVTERLTIITNSY